MSRRLYPKKVTMELDYDTWTVKIFYECGEVDVNRYSGEDASRLAGQLYRNTCEEIDIFQKGRL